MKGKKRETRKEWRSREKRHMADDEDILSSGCKDILNGLRGYPQRPARISSQIAADNPSRTAYGTQITNFEFLSI